MCITPKPTVHIIEIYSFYWPKSNYFCHTSRSKYKIFSFVEDSSPKEEIKIRTPPPLTAAPSVAQQSSITSPFQSFTAGHLLPSESIYESAAKLLFMSIKWARSVPSFLQLNEGDQTLLLEDSWAQLFVIGLAQWNIQFEEGIGRFLMEK